jgi:RNA polymerase sigma-70 factor (ECF subfamily)
MVSNPGFPTVEPAALASEAALVDRARAGDREALETLLRCLLDDAYAVAFRILGRPDEAQDAVQEGVLNAVRGLDGYRGEASFRTWLLRIVANAARSMARSNGRRRESALDDIAFEVAASEPEPDAGLLLAGEQARLEAALASLPEKQRLAVTLRIYQDLPYREIAVIAQCTEGSARVNYHLGLKRLKQLLQ